MAGVAVKVTEVPAHMVVAEAPMVTEGTTVGLTVMVMALEVAVAGEAQAAVDVMTQVITLPLARVALTYVLLLPPTFAPFSFH